MPISIEATTNTSILGETLPTCSPSPVYEVETSGTKDRVSAEKIYGNWYVVVNPDGTETYIQSDQASLVTEANCDDEKNTMDVSDGREQRESLDGNSPWFEVFSESDLINFTSESSPLTGPVKEGIQNLLTASNVLREILLEDSAYANSELSIYMYAIDTLDGTGDVILNTVVVSDGGRSMHFMAQTESGTEVVTIKAGEGQIPAFLPDTDRSLIPAVFNDTGEVPLSLLIATEDGEIQQSVDSTALVDSESIQTVFRISSVLVISADGEGDIFLDSSLTGSDSLPVEDSIDPEIVIAGLKNGDLLPEELASRIDLSKIVTISGGNNCDYGIELDIESPLPNNLPVDVQVDRYCGITPPIDLMDSAEIVYSSSNGQDPILLFRVLVPEVVGDQVNYKLYRFPYIAADNGSTISFNTLINDPMDAALQLTVNTVEGAIQNGFFSGRQINVYAISVRDGQPNISQAQVAGSIVRLLPYLNSKDMVAGHVALGF